MKKRCVTIILAMIMVLGSLIVTVSADGMYRGFLSVQYGQTEARSMLEMVNDFRTGEDAWYWDRDNTTKVYAEGLEPLEYDYNLEKTAMQRAAEIAVYFAHQRPDGQSCFTAFPDGYNSKGENIAGGQRTASAAYTSWREDNYTYSGQGHRRNMLSSSFNRIGIGHVVANGYHYWVQSLGRASNDNSETLPNDSVTMVTIEYDGSYLTTTLSGLESQYSGEAGSNMDVPTLTATLSSDDTWPTGSIALTADPVWTIEDPSIACIVENKIVFIKAGTTSFTAAQGDSSISTQITVTAVPEPSVPSNITSSSVNFDGKLFLNIYIKPNDEVMANPDSYYFGVTFNGVTTNYSVSNLLPLNTQGCVMVKQEMYAAMMRDQVTLQLFNSAGEVQPLTYKETTDVTDGFVYTALDYLKNRQEFSENSQMVELAQAAELYGIAVQVYFNYKTEQLTQEDISKMQIAASGITIPSTCEEVVTGQLPDGITNRFKTVLFEADNTLRQYFYFDVSNLSKYTFTLNGNQVTPIQKATGDAYYVEQPNIASGLLSTEYTFSISDGTDTYLIRSSTLGYAYNRQEKSTNPDMVNLCKLLYRYSQAADAYFKK